MKLSIGKHPPISRKQHAPAGTAVLPADVASLSARNRRWIATLTALQIDAASRSLVAFRWSQLRAGCPLWRSIAVQEFGSAAMLCPAGPAGPRRP